MKIHDVIKNLQNVNKQQSPVSHQARKNNLAVKLFSMEIAESFEEWDDPDIETLSTNLDGLLRGREEEEVDESDCSGSEEDKDEDDESVKTLKCCKCQKVYHTIGWLKRHEENCSGAVGKMRKTKPEKLSASKENPGDSRGPRI